MSAKKWPADQVQGQKIGRLKSDICSKSDQELSEYMCIGTPTAGCFNMVTWGSTYHLNIHTHVEGDQGKNTGCRTLKEGKGTV